MLNLLVISDDFALLTSDHTFVVSEFLTHYAKPGNIPCYVACRSHFVNTASVEHLYSLLSVLGYKDLLPCYSCQSEAIVRMVDKADALDRSSLNTMVERMSLFDSRRPTSHSGDTAIITTASAFISAAVAASSTPSTTVSKPLSSPNSCDNFTLIDIDDSVSSRTDSQETLVAYSVGGTNTNIASVGNVGSTNTNIASVGNVSDKMRADKYVALKSDPDMFSSMTAPLLGQGVLIEMSTLAHGSDHDIDTDSDDDDDSGSDDSFDHCN